MPNLIPDGKTLENMRPLIKAADGLTLSQVCSISGLEPSTIQNWVKRGFVARPVNKKYWERHLARILLIGSLRDAMKIENIGELMAIINGSADDESDDIISEEKLFDYFCAVIAKIKAYPASDEKTQEIIKDVLSDYVPAAEDAYSRLSGALRVMAYAYIASEYKSRAENDFETLKGVE